MVLPPRPRFVFATLTLAALCLRAYAAQPPLDPPVSPGAMPEVSALLDFFRGLSGKMILSGQQEYPDWFDVNVEPEMNFLQQQTGHLPVVRGFDFMSMSEGNPNLHVANRAIAWWRQNGIVTICYHWFVPGPNGQAFYTPATGYARTTNFDIRRALTPGTPEYVEFVAEMDIVAEELKILRDAHVPVIWRPFHECSGNWFWWSAHGAGPFKQAWLFMFDRFTNHHGLTNLIWCYNPTDTVGALEAWYPGDAYVDMIGLDIYPAAGTHPTYATAFRRFRDFTGGRKLVVMSENGPIPDPDQLFADGADWGYFCTWYGGFITGEGNASNPVDFVRRVYDHPRVITLDEMGSIHPRLDRPPAILVQPASSAAGTGANLTLAVVAGGSPPLTYEWRKNGVAIDGAGGATLSFPALSATDAGDYTVVVENANGTAASEAAHIAISGGPYAPPVAQLGNLSTRGWVGTGDDTMIAGLVVGGAGSKRVLLRAVGPTLGHAPYNVHGVLADPYLTLTTPDGAILATSDDWDADGEGATLEAAFASVFAFPLDAGSTDAALIASLPPGSYTALVRGADAGSGIALVEVYDLEAGSPAELRNLSTRARVGVGDEALIAGYYTLGGELPLLNRAVGPRLADFGVGSPLADPQLELTLTDGTPEAANDNWSASADAVAIAEAAARVWAFELRAGSTDSALLYRQPGAGGRTATVRSATGQPGIALVELYVVP